MLTAFLRAFRTPDLRRKLLFTVFIVAVFRLGSALPTPGVSESAVHACIGLANKAQAAGGRCATDSDCNPNGGSLYLCCNTHCVQSVSNKNCGACGNVCPQGTRCTGNTGFPACI